MNEPNAQSKQQQQKQPYIFMLVRPKPNVPSDRCQTMVCTIHYPEPTAPVSKPSTMGEYINLFQWFPIQMMILDINTLSSPFKSESPVKAHCVTFPVLSLGDALLWQPRTRTHPSSQEWMVWGERLWPFRVSYLHTPFSQDLQIYTRIFMLCCGNIKT